MKPFKNLTKQLLLFLMILGSTSLTMMLSAQTTAPPKTSLGSEFKFVFLQNRILSENNAEELMNDQHTEMSLWVYVANQEQVGVAVRFYANEESGTVSFDHSTITPPSGSIDYWEVWLDAGKTEAVEVKVSDYSDIRNAQMMYNRIHQKKMITVSTTATITEGTTTRNALLSVYAESRQSKSRDAALILPVQSLGSEYITITANRIFSEDEYPVDVQVKSNDVGNNAGPSEIAILAVEGDIYVTVTVPEHIRDLEDGIIRPKFYSAMDQTQTAYEKDKLNFYLREGEAVQLQSDFYDLTGLHIIATEWVGGAAGKELLTEVTEEPRKCAVFSGNMAAQVVYEKWESGNAYDHVYEQMYPVETWGCEYIAVNTVNDHFDANNDLLDQTVTGEKMDVYKIVAADDNTEINFLQLGTSGTSLGSNINLDRGEYLIVTQVENNGTPEVRVVNSSWEDVLDVNGNVVLKNNVHFGTIGPEEHFMVRANRAITVAQFTVSNQVVRQAGLSYYKNQDPSMVLLSPTDQTLEKLSFVSMPYDEGNSVCTSKDRQRDYVIVIAEDNHSHIELDGTAVTGWKNVLLASTGVTWKYAIVDVTNSLITHNVPTYHTLKYNSSATTPGGFISYAYGMNCRETYFYAAGINAEIRGLGPDRKTKCLELDDPNAVLDATYLNSLNLLTADGGTSYEWSLREAPLDHGFDDIDDILVDNEVQNPTFKSTAKFIKVGTYSFDCLIQKEETCDLIYTVNIVVPSCCNERKESETYTEPDRFIEKETSWEDRIFIEDDAVITLLPGAVLTINNSDVVFGQCAKIVVKPGAVIRANNSVFRACSPDAPWQGIFFESDPEITANNSSLFNECTFKHAVSAVNIENGESIGIHNNLFLNNYTAVNIEGQPETGDYSVYTKQISGNKFIVDNNVFNSRVSCAIDNGESIETLEHYGIKASNVEFSESITHNEFNNTMSGAENRVFVGILLNTASAKISQNSFTEMYHGIQVDDSKSNIIGNTFELTDMGEDKAQIDIRNSIIDTDIRSNEFTCWGDAMTERAIYLSDCKNVSVVDNEVTGFFIGILSVDGWNTLISKNKILDAVKFGIYADGIWGETGDEKMVISCNEVHMDMNRLDEASVGVSCENLKAGAKIISNCIFDCMVSIHISRQTFQLNVPSPIVANNFLYNYDWAGIYYYNVVSYSTGNKRAVRDNTYYSNSDAYDIASNRSETFNVEKSFGLFTVTTNIQIKNTANDDPRFSRASCGAQIFRSGIPTEIETGPVDMGVDYSVEYYKCDDNYSTTLAAFTNENWFAQITALSGTELEGMPFGEGEYSAMLQEAARHDMVTEANRIYEASQGSDLSELAKVRLSFRYHLALRNFDKASEVLVEALRNPELERWARLSTIRLTYVKSGLNRNAISKADIATLKELAQTLDYVGSGATALLNTLSFNARLKYISTADVEQPETLGRMSTVSNRIEVYPNPSKTMIDIQFSFESSEIAEMTIVDIYGKEVDWMKPSYISGTLNLDISQWESGFYFVNVTLENGELHSQKFVKI